MKKQNSNRGRDRRTETRVKDVAQGKKTTSSALSEELVEETFDWLERGGLRRILAILKVMAAIIVAAVLVLMIYLYQVSQ